MGASFDHGYVAAWDLNFDLQSRHTVTMFAPAWQSAGLDQVLDPVVGGWELRAGKDFIGAHLSLGGSQQVWLELGLNGQIVAQWTYSIQPGEGANPAALTSDGQVYGQRYINHKKRRHICIR